MTTLKNGEIARAAAHGLEWRKGYSGVELKGLFGSSLSGVIGGLSPDGGIFEDTALNRPVLSFECKFQGPNGNAIERWFKNYAVLQQLSIERYVSFCMGEGFWTGTAERIMAVAASMVPGRSHIWDDPTVEVDPDQKLFLYRFSSVDDAAARIGPLVESFVQLAIEDKIGRISL